MSNKHFTTFIDVERHQRSILEFFQAKHPVIWLKRITTRHACLPNVQMHKGRSKVEIIGRADDERFFALYCRVNGRTHREDGRRYFLLVSSVEDFQPGDAGLVQDSDIKWLEMPAELDGHLTEVMRKRMVTEPTLRIAA